MASEPQQPKQGIDIVYPDPKDSAASKVPTKVDIVAVPGIGPREDWTWMQNKTHWLRNPNMLGRKLSGARISIFQYESEWFGQGSINQLLDNIADQLIYALNRIRKVTETKTPIVFVCHSLGGIILEKALLTSRLRQANFPYIYPFVAGSIFLGTPFGGTNEVQAMILGQDAAKVSMAAIESWTKWLEADSETLRTLLYDFSLLVSHAQMRLFCFYECHETNFEDKLIMGMSPRGQQLVRALSPKKAGLIVDERSATIFGFEKLGLPTSHYCLNRFESSKDMNFQYVANEIMVIVQKAPGILKSRQNALRQALVDDRTYQSMRDHLGKGFQDIDAAKRGEKGPGATTAVLDLEAFKTWIARDKASILWVHGKAGTGQDAVAASALAQLESFRHEGSVVTSFYCDQSDRQRRSLQGMLQLIVRQIIDTNQDLAIHLLSDSKDIKGMDKQAFYPEVTLKERVLWDALILMAKELPNGFIYIVVNGLEQLSEESLSQFLDYISEFADGLNASTDPSSVAPLKWLVLSRTGRANIGRILQPRASELNLEDEKSIMQISLGLRSNISKRVDTLELPSSLAYFVKRHIHSRAEDNEIYVKLVIQEVKNIWVPGKTQHADVRRLLESFPYGLTNMFEHVRNRVLDPKAPGFEYIKEILRCRICAYVAPTLSELAVMAGLPKKDRKNDELLKAYLVQCGGFLTMDDSYWDNTVDWIDPSAQKYLQENAKEILALDLQDMQHGIIALRSLEYIYDAVDRKLDNEEEPHENDHDYDDANSDFASDRGNDDDDDADTAPTDSIGSEGGANKDENESMTGDEAFDKLFENTLKYPVHYWVEHAKRAPLDVLEEFHLDHPFWEEDSKSREKWWKIISEFHTEDVQTELSALHVAVILKFRALVDYLLEYRNTDDIYHVDSDGFQPLYHACAGGDEEIVDTLLGTPADINYPGDDSRPNALYAAASNGHFRIVKSLVMRDCDLNATSQDQGTALYASVANHDNDIVKYLLDKGADVNIIGGESQRALNVAALKGNLAGVQMLLDHNADIDPDDEYWYGSALGAAARTGHVEVVKLLLSKGWSPTRTMKTYGSFLTAAAAYNHSKIFDIFLEKEERLVVLDQALRVAAQKGFAPIVQSILHKASAMGHNIKCQKAFALAASYGRTEVLKLLFDRDISQEQLDGALYQATDNEREETVELLLEHGADPNAEGPTYGFALAASAYDGTTGILNALLAKGADVNKRKADSDYGTALQAAAFYGEVENVQLLLKHKATVNTEPIGRYGNPLQAAAFTGDEETIRLLIQSGANVNTPGGLYSYPIIAAVSEGHSVAVRVLLEHGAHVNVRGGENNWPVISLAASTLPKEDLKLIIKNVADINATCDKGTTALINCADASDKEGLQFLLDNDADVHIVSESLGSALHAAAANGDEDSCKVLIEAGADVNQIGGESGTALQAAAWQQDLETVRVLLDAGADVNAAGIGDYGTALIAACDYGSIEIVKELLNSGATIDVYPANEEHGSALTVAARSGYDDLVAVLIARKADVNFEGGYHGFPLFAAAYSGKLSMIKKLIDHGANASILGGTWGSSIIAAVWGNSMEVIEALVENGADIHYQGGEYGTALQAAAVKANDDIVKYIMDNAPELVTATGGRYHTAITAAAYFGHSDLVNTLLDAMADFRIQGGKYRSAITAAAIKGHNGILRVFLDKMPPRALLNEALVEACAHRQSTSVDMLIKAKADINAHHPELGTPLDALNAPQVEDENSDNEGDDDDDDDDEDDDDDDDDEDDDEDEDDDDDGDGDDEDGDDGSVTDLQLEEDISEEDKIRALLSDPSARLMRNGTVRRIRTVRHPGLQQNADNGSAMVPMPQLNRAPVEATYSQANPMAGPEKMYGQHQLEPWSPTPNSQPGSTGQSNVSVDSSFARHQDAVQHSNFPPVPSYPPGYPAPLIPRKQIPSPSGYPSQETPRGQSSPSLPQPERQYSTGQVTNQPRSFTPPSRSGSGDSGLKRQVRAVTRKSIASPALGERSQQRQSSYSSTQGAFNQSGGRQDYAAPNQPTPPPAAAAYGAYQPPPPPLQSQQQYPMLVHRQSQQFSSPQGSPHSTPPPQQNVQQQYLPYTAASPPVQQNGYIAYNQPGPQASYQSGNYSQSTPYITPPPPNQQFGSQAPLQPSVYHGQYPPNTQYSNQSQTSWDSTRTVPQGGGLHGQQSSQTRNWGTGGYEGEGYG